ncbi:hypothetical protein [Sutcliffiella cohnii]|uniref:hypothetical protein n=1 Tax=Sutcliffiella cohnii TaxID=33932 RepID=UPI00082EA173|nr:hypothetical protein [Sutcliffiella cohnii]
MKRILLAIGEPSYSKILYEKFKNYRDDFTVLEQEVLHHKYLLEIIENEHPEILIVHDYYLQSDKVSKVEKEREWLDLVETLRTEFDDSIRLVFLCERSKGDPFLSELVNQNVLDIFNNNSFFVNDLIEQLLDKPKYANVSKFKVGTSYSQHVAAAPKVETPQEEPDMLPEKEKEPGEEKEAPPIIQKVIEKKIINKVVNKQVVKREFRLNVTNNVDRIVGIPIERKLVLIGSPFKRSGSTFISHLLANVLSNMNINTTYIESPYSQAYTYDRFVGHENAPYYKSKFYKFTKEIDPKKVSEFDWNMDNINFITKHPSDEPVYGSKEVNFETFVKVLLTAGTPITIVDIGNDWDQEVVQEIYDMADHVFMVIEPDISNIQFLEESLDKKTIFYRKSIQEDKTAIIGNRFEQNILKNEIINDLYKDQLITLIPSFPSKEVFETQYNGGFLYEHKHLQQSIDEAMKPLLKVLLPDNFLKKKSGEKGWFKNIFNKSISIEPK